MNRQQRDNCQQISSRYYNTCCGMRALGQGANQSGNFENFSAFLLFFSNDQSAPSVKYRFVSPVRRYSSIDPVKENTFWVCQKTVFLHFLDGYVTNLNRVVVRCKAGFTWSKPMRLMQRGSLLSSDDHRTIAVDLVRPYHGPCLFRIICDISGNGVSFY